MIGGGAVGQFALGEIQLFPGAVTLLYDGTEIARKKSKVRDKIFERELEEPLLVRGSIYDSLHPPVQYNALQYPKAKPQRFVMVKPQEKLVDMMLKARTANRKREDGDRNGPL